MKKTLMFLTLFLTGCALNSSFVFLEIENIEPITSETVAKMFSCMNYGDEKACIRAKELLEEHPWQKDGNLKNVWIDNVSGMREYEWEYNFPAIERNLIRIKELYPEFAENE